MAAQTTGPEEIAVAFHQLAHQALGENERTGDGIGGLLGIAQFGRVLGCDEALDDGVVDLDGFALADRLLVKPDCRRFRSVAFHLCVLPRSKPGQRRTGYEQAVDAGPHGEFTAASWL